MMRMLTWHVNMFHESQCLKMGSVGIFRNRHNFVITYVFREKDSLRKPGQEPKAQTWRQGLRLRPWRKAALTAVARPLLFMQPRSTCLGMVLSAVGGPRPHQLTVKKMCHDMSTSQSDGGNFSFCGSFAQVEENIHHQTYKLNSTYLL